MIVISDIYKINYSFNNKEFTVLVAANSIEEAIKFFRTMYKDYTIEVITTFKTKIIYDR